jgi:hypothetical protein
MSKKIILVILALLLMIFICYQGSLVFLRWFFEEEVQYDETNFYTFDSNTLLQDLKAGKTDVFVLQEDYPGTPWGEPVEWSSEDYFFIAEVFHEWTSGETLDNWQLNGLMFSWDCEHFNKGPQYAYIRFIKVEKVRERKSRFESEVRIDPRNNHLLGGQIEHYPRKFRWKVIDTTKAITVDEALNIAEINGGSQFRESVNHECEILVSFFANDTLDYDGWDVHYYVDIWGDEGVTYHIDPMTGKVED